jgi:hypothetical protein
MSPIDRSVVLPIFRPLRDRVGHREELVAMLVQQQVVAAEMRRAHMPVEVLRLQVEDEDIRQQAA